MPILIHQPGEVKGAPDMTEAIEAGVEAIIFIIKGFADCYLLKPFTKEDIDKLLEILKDPLYNTPIQGGTGNGNTPFAGGRS
jgi:hypothetical protein